MEIRLPNKKLRIPLTDLIGGAETLNKLRKGKYTITVKLPLKKAYIYARELVLESDDSTVSLEIKRQYDKRSLDANAYAWHLIGELADAFNVSKELVYLIMLKRYGQGGVVKIQDKDADAFKRQVKYWEEHDKLRDERASYYRFWVGSSHYNTHEMYTFIQGLVSECKDQGIETLTPKEMQEMMAEW